MAFLSFVPKSRMERGMVSCLADFMGTNQMNQVGMQHFVRKGALFGHVCSYVSAEPTSKGQLFCGKSRRGSRILVRGASEILTRGPEICSY